MVADRLFERVAGVQLILRESGLQHASHLPEPDLLAARFKLAARDVCRIDRLDLRADEDPADMPLKLKDASGALVKHMG